MGGLEKIKTSGTCSGESDDFPYFNETTVADPCSILMKYIEMHFPEIVTGKQNSPENSIHNCTAILNCTIAETRNRKGISLYQLTP